MSDEYVNVNFEKYKKTLSYKIDKKFFRVGTYVTLGSAYIVSGWQTLTGREPLIPYITAQQQRDDLLS